jgi:hypothetical protein
LPFLSLIVATPSFVVKLSLNKGIGMPLLKSNPAYSPKYQILVSFCDNTVKEENKNNIRITNFDFIL